MGASHERVDLPGGPPPEAVRNSSRPPACVRSRRPWSTTTAVRATWPIRPPATTKSTSTCGSSRPTPRFCRPSTRRSLRIDKGHLRHLPRLRRTDRRGAAERHSVDAGVHHLQGKAEGVNSNRAAAPASRVLPRTAGAADATRVGGALRLRLRRQQRVSVHHQPRRDARLVAAARAARPGRRDSRRIRPRPTSSRRARATTPSSS